MALTGTDTQLFDHPATNTIYTFSAIATTSHQAPRRGSHVYRVPSQQIPLLGLNARHPSARINASNADFLAT